jgi:ribonuclease VapC
MVIDSSALIAILMNEPDAERFASAIEAAELRLMGATSAFEAAIVIAGRNRSAGMRELDILILEARIELVPFTADHYTIARDAWLRYGKSRHPARLNFGDCCAYATAKLAGEPLLFKGADFAQTDVESAI